MNDGLERGEESRVGVVGVDIRELVVGGEEISDGVRESGGDGVEGPAEDVAADDERRLRVTG